ncbi:MAG: GyrI-like domain-containing protein [Demequina sp.]
MRVESRPALTYCALPVEVTMSTLTSAMGPAIDELERYMDSRGIQPSGPSLLRYRTVSERAPFIVEVGWVMEETPWIDVPFVADTLPAGRYAVAVHEGPYSQLSATTGELLDWGRAEHMIFDVIHTSEGSEWASWYELYTGVPAYGPDGPAGTVEVCVGVIDERQRHDAR